MSLPSDPLRQDEESLKESLKRAESVVGKIGRGERASAPRSDASRWGCGYLACLLASGLLSAGVAFWVGLPDFERDAFLDRASKVGTATAKFAQSAFRILVGVAPPPPDFGDSSSSPSLSLEGRLDAIPLSPSPLQDENVRPEFINDLAAWIVSCYPPPSPEGSLCLSFEAFLSRYGKKPIGLLASGVHPQRELCRYVLAPGMMRGLYDLYSGLFVDALKREASRKGKGLGRGEMHGLYSLLFAKSVALAKALESIAAMDGLRERVFAFDAAKKEQTRFEQEVERGLDFYGELERLKAPDSRLKEAQGNLEVSKAGLLAARQSAKAARSTLVSALSQSGLKEEESVHLLLWAARRIEDGSGSRQSLLAFAGILRNLSKRFDELRSASDIVEQDVQMSRPNSSSDVQGADACFHRHQGERNECLLPSALPGDILSPASSGGSCLRRSSVGK